MPGGGGGGSIKVEPAALDAIASRLAGVTGGTSSARGGVAGTGNAAAGCAAPAAGAFARLHELLGGALAVLDDSCGALGSATTQAAVAYQGTDAAAMPGGITTCPAGP